MDDLDDILDSALDDFRKVEISQNRTKSAGKAAPLQEKAAPTPSDGSGPSVSDGISEASSVQGLGIYLPPLPAGKRKTNGSRPNSSPLGIPSLGSPKVSRGKKGEEQKPLSATLEKLAEQTRQTVGSIDAEEEDNTMGEALVDNLMKQFEELGDTQDMQSIMDTMMRQLLSKEVLHEPMKEIGERYPIWLAANKSNVSKEDYARYSRQHLYIVQLCQVYDSSPDDFQQIMNLMQSMQNCGQPPSDIVRELAPGLDLDQNGLPMFPDLSAAGAGPGGANCSIM